MLKVKFDIHKQAHDFDCSELLQILILVKEPLHNSDLTVVQKTLNTVRVLKKHFFQLKAVFLVRKTAQQVA